MMKRSAERGFTLVELMIVVVIVAILAAMVYPSYLEHVRKAKRAEAKSALMQVLMQQERYYTQNNEYKEFTKDAPAGFKVYSGDSADSSAYALKGAACGAGIKECVQVTAEVNAEKFTDDSCKSLSMTSAGVKSSTGTGGTDFCWR